MATQKTNNKRGTFLTVLIIISAIFSFPSIFTIGETKSIEMLTGVPVPWFPLFSLVSLVMTYASLYGMWTLKKWGVYLLIAVNVLQIGVLAYIMPELLKGLWLTVVFIGLWTWAIYPRWKYFK